LAGALENKNAVLTPDEMARADKFAIQGGMSGARLMENAGQAVKSVVLAHYPCIRRALVLCGPGNNGGDGYAAARLLAALGIETLVFRSRAPKPGTDAEAAATAWNGPVLPHAQLRLEDGDVVIDALYGAGFSGALDGDDARAAETVRHSAAPVISVDLPSGVYGLTGICGGVAFQAAHTVTFFRKKPGHLLYPGRGLCGRLHVADIGIGSRVLDEIVPKLWENAPMLFSAFLPKPDPLTHKYARGHAGVFSGGAASTGAARLAAMAAAREGAGAVTLYAPSDALPELAAHLTSVMLKKADDVSDLAAALAEPRLAALVIGPGFGRCEWLREAVGLVLKCRVERSLVLDADVFSAFAPDPEALFGLIKAARGRVSAAVSWHFQKRLGKTQQGARSREAVLRGCALQRPGHCHRIARWPRGGQLKRRAGAGDGGIGRCLGRGHRRAPGAGHACIRGGLRRGVDAWRGGKGGGQGRGG
jgi:ADP-dependent NAD(P)H-hydrate dehydratase / NAD(P)H-hydrate epimerase